MTALARLLAAVAMLAATTLAAQAGLVCVTAPYGGLVCFYNQGINDAQARASQTCGDRFFDNGPC